MGLNGDDYKSKVCKYCGTALANDSNICPWCHKAQDESEVKEANNTRASVENKNSRVKARKKKSQTYILNL